MAKTAFVIASWLASAVVIGHAHREFAWPIRFDEAIVELGRFEEALARTETRR